MFDGVQHIGQLLSGQSLYILASVFAQVEGICAFVDPLEKILDHGNHVGSLLCASLSFPLDNAHYRATDAFCKIQLFYAAIVFVYSF